VSEEVSAEEKEVSGFWLICKLLNISGLEFDMNLERIVMTGLKKIYLNRDADNMGIGAQKDTLQDGVRTE
jgi:hypothetical protein